MPRTMPQLLVPPEKLARYRELKERLRQQEAEKARRQDVFGLLGYEPNCKPRYAVRAEAAERMGISDPFDAAVSDAVAGLLPPPCGQCPQELFHAATEFDILFGGSAGGGKGGRCPDRTAPSYDVSVETKVLTPKGFKLIGDVAVGDQVSNPDGTVSRVIRIFDNGPKQFYRVTLSDGSSVEADEDHLWAINVAGHRRRRKQEPEYIPPGLRSEDEWNLRVQARCRIVNTVQLRELALQADRERERGERPHPPMLPLANPLKMTGVQTQWPVLSPYILGALVGDGCLREDAISITGIDEPVFERIRAELPPGLQLVAGSNGGRRCPVYRITQTETKDLLAPFKAELKLRRAAREIGQRELAALAGTTQAQLSMIERGMVWPRRRTAEALDEALGAEGALLGAYAERQSEHPSVLLKRDGLLGTHSWDKFIPRRIKVGVVADRFAFIQGLLDTDGTMDQRGHVSLTTVSERLALDAQEVLRSLGYKATITTKQPTYTHLGEKREGRLAYGLYIRGRHMDRLFHMPRKRERVMQYNGGNVEPFHRVVSVEPTGVDNSRCIQVDNLNHLYVTDDYIVTHNSRALTAEGIRAAVRYPGLRIGAFRRTYPELEESLLTELAQMGYAHAVGAVWNGSAHELRFPNSSRLMFRYAESIADATRRQGGQYQLLLFDERTLTPPAVISFLESRLRSGRADVPVLGIRSTSNPGGAGHGAVKKKYITATDHGEKVVTDERGRTVRFIPSRLADNPHVNEEYASDLKSLDEKLRAAFLDGNWDMFAGQMFTGLNHDRHVVEPFTLPASWKRYNGIDWGFAKPWAVLWAAVDEDGRAWFYREIHEAGVGESEQARRILEAEADDEQVLVRYADDAMWATRGEQKPIADIYAENGVYLTEAGKGGRVPGWQRVRSYVKDGPACPHHRAAPFGWVTCPMMHIFSTCPEFYRTLSDLPHATKGNVEDAATDGEDHLPDAARYLLINLGGGPSWPDNPPPEEKPDLEKLEPRGPFAFRRHDADDLADRDPKQGTVQKPPWA